MELEYRDDSRKGRYVILAGVVLAIVAGGIAFYTLNQAQQQAGQSGLKTIPVVVAVNAIPARGTIKTEDVTLRDVPLDPSNANGVVSDSKLVVGRIAAVTILQGQIVTTNMLASSDGGAGFSILGPDETVAPDSPAWRAIAISVPDDLAVAGMLTVGQTVDVILTMAISVAPGPSASAAASFGPEPSASPRYIAGQGTKVTYQDVVILARKDNFYIIRAPLAVAEELAHLQATGAATFSMVLRPIQDGRLVDASKLGETTNRIIIKYGLPIPEALEPGYTAAPTPTLEPVSPSPSPTPSPS